MVSRQRKTFTKCKNFSTEMFLNLSTGINYCIDLANKFNVCNFSKEGEEHSVVSRQRKTFTKCKIFLTEIFLQALTG